jgi:hypothetical protein
MARQSAAIRPQELLMALLDPSWMPNCSMTRVICHWTAGQHRASDLDRAHYHILVEADGRLVRGHHDIEANVSTADGRYAAHTRQCNTGSIGVAACCMVGAQERPFKPGQSPLTRTQWDTMAQVAADLCRFYRIPVTPRTVLGHGEVEVNLGIQQAGKWDPMVLPWNPGLSRTEVGEAFRALVQLALEGAAPEETAREVIVVLGGRRIGTARMEDGRTWAPTSAVARLLRWTTLRADAEGVRFRGPGSPDALLPSLLVDDDTYVDIETVAAHMGRQLTWDHARGIVTVREARRR